LSNPACVWVVMSNCTRVGTKLFGEPLLWVDHRGPVLLLFSTLEKAQKFLHDNKTTAEGAQIWEMEYDKCIKTVGQLSARFAVIDPGPVPADWQLFPLHVSR
jgi:hypothetical protein